MKKKNNFFILFLLLAACTHFQSENKSAAQCDVQLGLGYLKSGDIERAYHKLQLAVNAAPENSESLNAMAYYYDYLNETEQARRWYERAIHDAPSGQGFNNYGVFLCKQGEYKKAMLQFHEALKDKNYMAYKVYENAGLCALSQQDPKTAIPLLQKALSYQSESSLLRDVLVKAKRGVGKKG